VSFASPARFGGGGYVAIFTPEVKDFTLPCLVSMNLPVAGGASGPGNTAGFQFTTWGFQTPASGGGTAQNIDFTFGDVYVNFAAFAFAADSDLRVPVVGNYLAYSENFLQWGQTNIEGRLVAVPSVTDPSGGTSVFQFTGNGGSPNQFVSLEPQNSSFLINKLATLSLHVKPATGQTLELLVGGGGNNFGYNINASTNALVASGTVPSGGSLTGSVQSLADGWKRVRLTFSTPFTPVPLFRPNNDASMNGKTVYVWGAQVEGGSVATPYVRTTTTAPVLGNQDERKRLVPGACGFGISGGTYSSHLTALMSKRTATAYGTIVIPPRKNDTVGPVMAYIENGYGVSGVSAGANSTFDVLFSTPLTNANYCVILSAENESQIISIGSDYGEILEHSMLLVDRSYKTVNGFRAVALKQNSTNNSWYRASVRYQGGYTERIHFMVFGGGTYGQP